MPPLVRFNCHACGTRLDHPGADTGKQVPCPACGAEVTVPAMGLHPGQRIGGFELVRRIGRGGMGEVWLATQLTMHRQVALKLLSPAAVRDAESVQRFLNEVRLLASLDHPNIVTAFEAGQSGELYFLAMSYVNGQSVEQRIAGHRALPEHEALQIALKVALALQYAWDKLQLLHRDIKPANILIDQAGEVKLTDLGVSKLVTQQDASLTTTGVVVGTPHYMSLEQATARGALDFRTDMYSLGATLFHLLTGDPPFDADTPMAVVAKMCTEPTPGVRERNPKVSLGAAQVVRLLMAREPDDRYPNWAELIADLRAVRKGKPPMRAMAWAARPARRPVEHAPGAAAVAGSAPSLPPPGHHPIHPAHRYAWQVLALLALILSGGLWLASTLHHPPTPAPGTGSLPGSTLVAQLPATTPDVAPRPATTLRPLPPATPAVVPAATLRPLPPASPAPVPPTSAVVAVAPPPTDAEVRLHALGEMYQYALDYAHAHPADFAASADKFRQVAVEAAGTKYALMAEDELARLATARQTAVNGVMVKLARQAQTLQDAGKYAAAIAVYRDYAGPFAAETAAARAQASAPIAAAAEAAAAAKARLDEAIQQQFATLLRTLADAILVGDFATAATRLDEAHADPQLQTRDADLAAAGKLLDTLRRVPDRLRDSWRADLDQEVVLEFKTHKEKMILKAITATEIRGLQEVRDGTGRISQTFKVADLSLNESLKRLGPEDSPEQQAARALVAAQNKRPDLAAELFTANGSPLGLALAQTLKQRLADGNEAAAERGFADLIALLDAPARLATDAPGLLEYVRSLTITKVQVLALQKATDDYRQRYAGTTALRDHDAALALLADLGRLRWPGVADGLVFLWEDAHGSNRVPDASGKGPRRCELDADGKASLGANGQLLLAGGAFFARDVDELALLAACRKTNELSVSVWLKAADLEQDGPARIVSFGRDATTRDFTLAQSKRKLLWRMRTAPRAADTPGEPDLLLATLDTAGPCHLLVTTRPGLLRAYVNGVLTLETTKFDGDFSGWLPMRLVVGNEKSSDRAWKGELQGIAILNRFLDADEASTRYDLALRRFKPEAAATAPPAPGAAVGAAGEAGAGTTPLSPLSPTAPVPPLAPVTPPAPLQPTTPLTPPGAPQPTTPLAPVVTPAATTPSGAP